MALGLPLSALLALLFLVQWAGLEFTETGHFEAIPNFSRTPLACEAVPVPGGGGVQYLWLVAERLWHYRMVAADYENELCDPGATIGTSGNIGG